MYMDFIKHILLASSLQNVLYLSRLSDGSRIRELPLDIGSIVGFSGKKKQTEVSMQAVMILRFFFPD